MQLIGSIVLQFGRAIAGTLCKTKFAISKIWLILPFYVCRLINFLWHMISISICFEAWKKNLVILLALGIIFYPFFIVSIVFLCLFSTAALTLTSISTIKLHWNDTQECIFVLNTPRFMGRKIVSLNALLQEFYPINLWQIGMKLKHCFSSKLLWLLIWTYFCSFPLWIYAVFCIFLDFHGNSLCWLTSSPRDIVEMNHIKQ